MAFRRFGLCLLVVAAVGAACASDDVGEGISPQEPIGAPEAAAEYHPGSDDESTQAAPAVIKDGKLELGVTRDKLTSAAQRVVDVVNNPKIGGYLVSSLLDLEDGLGHAEIVVKVPADRFETAIIELGTIGEVRRQSLEGQDQSGEYARARNSVFLASSRVKSLLNSLEETDDRSTRFELRQKLADAKSELARSQKSQSDIESTVTYSTIQVALLGTPPPPPPEKPVLDRALGTAKTISLAVVSGIVLAAGALVPIGVLLFVVYVIALQVRKRVRIRLDS